MPYADKQRQLAYKRAWNKQYYQKNKIKEKERIAKRKKEISEWFMGYKSRLMCERCGEKETICLEFHHIKERDKDFNLGQVKSWGWGKKRIEKEIKKCIVLCANCHRKLHADLI